MSDNSEDAIFSQNFERKIDELIAWAVMNAPNENDLSYKDFDKACEHLREAAYGKHSSKSAPEPADGGPQYESVTPAPWP